MLDDVIAVDGPAASGKSTIAEKLSERLGIPYINTGNMYRAITWRALESGIDLANPTDELLAPVLESLSLEYVKNSDGLYEILLDGEFPGSRIRTPEVASFVSPVAAVSSVRSWLKDKQRDMASLGLIVMEGRDIGTVIFPEAKHKFFLTASPRVRAERRLAQAGETFGGATVESVANEIAERDRKDMSREVAPLKQADDAVLVDSSYMTIDEVLDFIISKIKSDNEN